MRDHGGGIDAASERFGGARQDWVDLSTGINPHPYPLPDIPLHSWTALPDHAAQARLVGAARRFWSVPEGAAIIATPGASAPIALLPRLAPAGRVHIAAPTYNEHAAAFAAAGWTACADPGTADAQVVVHPNNPDGRCFDAGDLTAPLRVIDESFCDVMPDASQMPDAVRPGTVILKSFGKFWGLAGLRLGFAIGDPVLIDGLRDLLGPWPVAGPALDIGAAALDDPDWAAQTRDRLAREARRLDTLFTAAGATCIGGTTLFRLFEVDDAQAWQDRLARHHIWTRVFPYNPRWLRVGLPPQSHWSRIEDALA